MADTGPVRHPHARFLVAFGLVGPVIAMAGVAGGGLWRGVGVGLAGVAVAVAAAGSWLHARAERDVYTPLRWRMMAVTGVVAVVALAVAAGALVWLVVEVLG